ncbi:MAG: VOC family protein [Gammaproteobacteria bacterium]
MAHVRYIVDDVEASVDFYVSKLGFKLEQQYGSAFAIVVHGDYRKLCGTWFSVHP